MVRAITPAGWALRHFSLAAFEAILRVSRPALIEVSKDSIRDDLSLKDLGRAVDRLRAETGASVGFAGTSDLVGCAGLSWDHYRRYLAVQIAQARFLGCSRFRPLLGVGAIAADALVDRLAAVCDDAREMTVCIEVHAGPESDPAVLARLLRDLPIDLVIDLQNVREAGYSADQLQLLVPPERIAYFHQRNLPDAWVEHPATLDDEVRWHRDRPDAVFLWEPKTVEDPTRIVELYGEHRRSH